MFKALLNDLKDFFLGEGGTASVPHSAEAAVAESLGRQILAARARRLEILEESKDLLIGIPMEDRPGLVDRLAARFAVYVWDLPASEDHHDAEPFGLLDHSLEVARAAVGELVRPSFRPSEDPAANCREQPVWAYSGFVLGLLHDVGKLFDLDVRAPGSDTAWKPLSEPLGLFIKRLGSARSGREWWNWKEGRGQNGHVSKGEGLVPAILPAATRMLLGHRLGSLLQAFTRSYEEGVEDWGRGPAGRVVQVVRHWDRIVCKSAKGEAIARPTPPAPLFVSVTPPPLIVASALTKEPPSKVEASVQQLLPWPTDPAAAQAKQPELWPDPPGAGTPKPLQAAEKKPRSPQRPLSEEESRIQTELEPARLIETVRTWVRAGNARRNNSRADMLVTPEFLWLKYPQAFMDILEGAGINWSKKVGERLLLMLRKHPLVAPLDPNETLVPATPTSRAEDMLHFVRIKPAGFLGNKELASLGLWSPGLTLVTSGTPKNPAANRAIEMRKAS